MKKIYIHPDLNPARLLTIFAVLFCFLSFSTAGAYADDDFALWIDELRAEALSKGISEATLDMALTGLTPIERVIERDRNQPEFKKDFWSYLRSTVTSKRISKGRKLLEQHRELLDGIEKKYGVQPRFLVAIWGLESNFGKYTGTYPIIDSVATLAYDPRRSKFFRAQLFSALQILDEGHISLSEMKGSWAGAMGQLQFMPSTFISFAVDENQDGRKDIWHSLPDIFASAARFLSGYGWNNNFTWGRKVLVPKGLEDSMIGTKTVKTLREWQKAGIRRINGDDLPDVDINASLIKPAGKEGPYFLVYDNYKAILRWNRSHLYALAVSHLADKLVN